MSTKFLSPGWRMPRNTNQSKSSNYSLDFGGSNQYISSSPTLSGLTDVTVSCWAKFENINNNDFQYVLIAYNTSQSGSYRVGIGMIKSDYSTVSDRYKLYTIDGSNLNISSFVVSQDVWYNIVVTQSGTVRKLFVNGDLISTFTGVPSLNLGNNLEIGRFSNNNHYFPGKINSVSIFDYALSESQVTTLWGGGTEVSNPMALPSPPIAYYPLGESAGGFVGGSGTWLTENNAIGDYVFDFNTDFVTLNSSISLTGNRTVSFWIKPESLNGNVYIGGSGTDNRYPYITSTAFWLKDSTGAVSTAINISVNNWYHFCVTGDGTTASVYINGDFISTMTDKSPTLNTIGADAGGGGAVDSKFSNVQIFDTALTSPEVETLYNYGSPIQTLASIPQNSNLKAWYKLDASEVYNSSTTEWEVNEATSPWTSSLDFDSASSDYIDCGASSFSGETEISVSAWVYPTATGTGAAEAVLSTERTSSTSRGFYLSLFIGNEFRWQVSTDGSSKDSLDSGTILLNQWSHVAATWNQSTMSLYVNGSLVDTINTVNATGTFTTTNNIFIAKRDSSAGFFPGSISNASIWNTALSPSQITELYNNGTPSNLSSHSVTSNLISWWKLNNLTTGIEDSKGSNNGTNNGATEVYGSVSTLNGESSGMTQANLVQSDLQTVAPYSKYAMSFDSADSDYINTNYNANLIGSSPQSFSMWFKSKSTGIQYKSLMGQYQENLLHGWGIEIGQPSNLDKITWYSRNSTIDRTSYGSALTQNQWYHLVVVINSASLNNVNYSIYLDGTPLVENATSSYYDNTSILNSFQINNRYANNVYYGGGNFVISNASTWNTDLTSAQVTEIYNEGLPSNLNSHSAYSNLVSWWQLGENSSYTGDWIFADEKGANNGEGQNLTEINLTNGVGTTANGVSSGMSEGSLVGDAPYSTANAISSGMSVVSRVTGVSDATITTGGTGYSTGTNIATTGGSGTNCTINITTVSGGAITAITINSGGNNYLIGDVLTVSGGNGNATITVSGLNTP